MTSPAFPSVTNVPATDVPFAGAWILYVIDAPEFVDPVRLKSISPYVFVIPENVKVGAVKLDVVTVFTAP